MLLIENNIKFLLLQTFQILLVQSQTVIYRNISTNVTICQDPLEHLHEIRKDVSFVVFVPVYSSKIHNVTNQIPNSVKIQNGKCHILMCISNCIYTHSTYNMLIVVKGSVLLLYFKNTKFF